MSMSELYHDYNIDTAPEGHKHSRRDWINIECPHCTGSFGYHLGFHMEYKYYSCHRCGYHNVTATLAILLKVPKSQAGNLAQQYEVYTAQEKASKSDPRIALHPFKFPSDLRTLQGAPLKYLRERGYDAKYIQARFKLKGTGPGASLNGISYKFRIIAPIYWQREVVSFQGRDYTDKQSKKYLACPMAREVIHHKHIIYGREKTWRKRTGIAVEGIFDVWRFVSKAFCTFGIGYTDKQVFAIARTFDRVFVVFDSERQAQRQARKLGADLGTFGIEIINIKPDTDPAEMSQEEADYLLKQLNDKKIQISL